MVLGGAQLLGAQAALHTSSASPKHQRGPHSKLASILEARGAAKLQGCHLLSIPGCAENNPTVFVTSIYAASWRRA